MPAPKGRCATGAIIDIGCGSAAFSGSCDDANRSTAELETALATIASESALVELCNGKDDDCNGACDEPFPLVAVTNAACSNPRAATACDNGALAGTHCFATGSYVCSMDGLMQLCSAPTCATDAGLCPTTETANGLDDDCDGVVDDCVHLDAGSCDAGAPDSGVGDGGAGGGVGGAGGGVGGGGAGGGAAGGGGGGTGGGAADGGSGGGAAGGSGGGGGGVSTGGGGAAATGGGGGQSIGGGAQTGTGGGGSPADAGVPTMQAKSGCGCSAGADSVFGLLGLLWAVRRRARTA